MKYLIRDKGVKQKAHFWDERKQDTKCKMWSTGGMSRDKPYTIHDSDNGKLICTMCKNNSWRPHE